MNNVMSMQLDGELEGPTGPLSNHHKVDNELIKKIREIHVSLPFTTWKYTGNETFAIDNYVEKINVELGKHQLSVDSFHIQKYLESYFKGESDYESAEYAVFVSCLMQQSEEHSFLLDTSDLESDLIGLGSHLNGKKLRVIGSAGKSFGYKANRANFEATTTGVDAGLSSKECAFFAQEIEESSAAFSSQGFYCAEEIGSNAGRYGESNFFFAKKFGSYQRTLQIDKTTFYVGDSFEEGAGFDDTSNFFMAKTLMNAGDNATKSVFLAQKFIQCAGSQSSDSSFIGETFELDSNRRSSTGGINCTSCFSASSSYYGNTISKDGEPFDDVQRMLFSANFPHHPTLVNKAMSFFEDPHYKALCGDNMVQYFKNNIESAKEWAKQMNQEIRQELGE